MGLLRAISPNSPGAKIVAVVEADNFDIHIGKRDADAADLVRSLVGIRHDGRHRFGEAVAFDHPSACLFLKIVLDRFGQGRRTDKDSPQAAEIVAVNVRQVAQLDKHRRYADEEAGFALLNGLGHLFCVEAGDAG